MLAVTHPVATKKDGRPPPLQPTSLLATFAHIIIIILYLRQKAARHSKYNSSGCHHHLLSSNITQNGDILVPANPDPPGKVIDACQTHISATA